MFPVESPAGIQGIRLLAQRNWTTVNQHPIDISEARVYSDSSATIRCPRCGSAAFGISTCNTLERCSSSRRIQKNFS